MFFHKKRQLCIFAYSCEFSVLKITTVRKEFLRRKPPKLARRERQIVHLAIQGKAPKEIAHALELDVRTVYARTEGILRKAGLTSPHEIVPWALQHPESLRRDATCELGLHPPGCTCDSPYCQAMRIIAA